ncbi:hypothetical protein SE17_33660 [Kouleothrix aurantiaca]|uniref:Uncharacterized protein n=1 Tax=Kouleothrix aurantiaca TaxID=186479 RepID=A0A0P9DH51_9CHLR|nr:hypothetical protein SE17_33660 [Kouleothrix aurantiaca]
MTVGIMVKNCVLTCVKVYGDLELLVQGVEVILRAEITTLVTKYYARLRQDFMADRISLVM